MSTANLLSSLNRAYVWMDQGQDVMGADQLDDQQYQRQPPASWAAMAAVA